MSRNSLSVGSEDDELELLDTPQIRISTSKTTVNNIYP